MLVANVEPLRSVTGHGIPLRPNVTIQSVSSPKKTHANPGSQPSINAERSVSHRGFGSRQGPTKDSARPDVRPLRSRRYAPLLAATGHDGDPLGQRRR